jgi:hypothetical protein
MRIKLGTRNEHAEGLSLHSYKPLTYLTELTKTWYDNCAVVYHHRASFFYFSAIDNNNMADAQTFQTEVY